ncbi:UPF0160 protein [Cercospora beticola]|uniref:UPF0160 protein n=1 Tax=Cercospora beticola TaxID=122368 RepID=A0A2G5HJ12_CERBT|nr:UPF0160 protein [Cercospora beticola]PIA92528.1 UPF0160 protein [Cercospora beticola]WPB02245.1 hypothetical protein RHO25_006879 [Cercospora beticola]
MKRLVLSPLRPSRPPLRLPLHRASIRSVNSPNKAKTTNDIFQRLVASNPHLYRPLLQQMTSEPSSKRQKMADGTAAPVIGTHNGHFHADEALAVYLLRLLPDYKGASLIRTRDSEVLKTCTIVVDVGGVHDDAIFRYDHHQREFKATFPGKNTKLSSAGLVWMHYGKRIVSAVTGLDVASSENELLYQKLYEDFVQAFDANDNGISVYDPAEIRKAGIEKKTSDKGFSIASVVGRYNHAPVTPAANNINANGFVQTSKAADQADEDARFARASAFVGEQFSIELSDKFLAWLPARNVVAQAFNSRHAVDPQGRILVVPWKDGGVPWMDHLYALEEETGAQGSVLYALFAESGEQDSKWRIRAVSLEPGSFENRKGLPEAWRGVRDDELSKLSGVPGSIFVHAAGFIGGNQTFDGALEMAKKALEM